MRKGEPWYVHFIMYVIIAILVFVLIKVAYLDPNEVIEQEKYFKQESRLRMSNLRSAERLWQEKFGKFTDNLDSLINFVKTDTGVKQAMEGIDTVTKRSTNPFVNLSAGLFEPDSLYFSPKSRMRFVLQVDTSEVADTIIDRRGRILKVDLIRTIGQRYFIGCPDGYGTIGDIRSDAMKNTASWE
ncbi:MAG: hypothetical protein RDU14_11860 [Melioribacteraceae bacterium]|jgi:hypothetical protein|nr:hypothetical protein [Melioribacteraceae bacterium]